MKRSIGDTATDPQTGFVWVCVHTDAHYGPHWVTYHPARGTRTSDEPAQGPPAAEGLARALAAGVQNKAQCLLDLMGADIRARSGLWAGHDLRVWYDHGKSEFCLGTPTDRVSYTPTFSSPSLAEVLEWGKLL